MKSRSSSITERLFLYGAGITVLVVSVILIFFIGTYYNTQIAEIKSQEESLEKQKMQLENEVQSLEMDIQRLEREYDKQVQVKKEEEEEYYEVEEKFEEAKLLLPPEEIKSDIMEELINTANSNNLAIIYFDQLIEENEEYGFKPVTFEFVLSGSYFRIKEFLYFVDRPLRIEQEEKLWNVILKIPYPEGFSFYRYNLETDPVEEIHPDVYKDMVSQEATTVIEEEIESSQSEGRRDREGGEEVAVRKRNVFDLNGLRNFIRENDHRIIMEEDTDNIKVRILIKSYFVRD
ncbi:MAG: hypothetical protein ACQESP_03680 [Candidatus Muiribacteriota bacterium]